MKKQNILILVSFVVLLIVSIIQIINASFTTGIANYPPNVTLKDVQRWEIHNVIITNSTIFIILTLIIIIISKIIIKFRKLNNK